MLELLVRYNHLSLVNTKCGNPINGINGNSASEKERDRYKNRDHKFNCVKFQIKNRKKYVK